MAHIDPTPTDTGLWDEQETAARLSVSPRTLEAWRGRGGGPPYLRLARRCIRYSPAAVGAWLRERERRSTSDPGPRPEARHA